MHRAKCTAFALQTLALSVAILAIASGGVAGPV